MKTSSSGSRTVWLSCWTCVHQIICLNPQNSWLQCTSGFGVLWIMCTQSSRVFKNQNGVQSHGGQNLRQIEISKLADVSAEVGLRPPAHISAVQTSFFFISTVSRYCRPGTLLLPWESVGSPLPGLGSHPSAQATPGTCPN